MNLWTKRLPRSRKILDLGFSRLRIGQWGQCGVQSAVVPLSTTDQSDNQEQDEKKRFRGIIHLRSISFYAFLNFRAVLPYRTALQYAPISKQTANAHALTPIWNWVIQSADRRAPQTSVRC